MAHWLCRNPKHLHGFQPVVVDKIGGHASRRADFPCRAGFYTLPTNFFSARYKTAPYIEPIFLVGQGFIPCRQIFSARCKTAPYIKPDFPCRAGFYTLPTNFLSARFKTAPYIKIFLVGQGFTPCRRIFSVRCKTAPYIEPIFRLSRKPTLQCFGSAGAEPSEFYEFRFSSEGKPLACRIFSSYTL